MNEYTLCSRCNEKPAAICISCLTDCTEQKPAAGEFTKVFRKFLNDPESDIVQWEDMSREACDSLDRAESENRRLKKAIEDYGNNPAGFDWAILEKIENQESINADLLAACEKVQEWLDTSSLQRILVETQTNPNICADNKKVINALIMGVASNLVRLEAAIAKAKKEG